MKLLSIQQHLVWLTAAVGGACHAAPSDVHRGAIHHPHRRCRETSSSAFVPNRLSLFNSYNYKYLDSSTHTRSLLSMALTEEFLQINKGAMTTTSTSNTDPINTNNNNRPRRPPSDQLGYLALHKVQSLARSAGIKRFDGGSDENSSTRSRSEFIDWQRDNLRHVRAEVARGRRGSVGDSGVGANSSINNGGENHSGVRRMLINALPSSNNKQYKMSFNNHNSNNGPTSNNKNGNNQRKSKRVSSNNNNNNSNNNNNDDPTTITTALQTLERDMTILDNLASLQPQLSLPEVGLLLGAVAASGIGPIVFPGTSVTEVLAPAAAAFTASITIGSEYIGRVAVADGKEIAGEFKKLDENYTT
jgi:hypothetical protein